MNAVVCPFPDLHSLTGEDSENQDGKSTIGREYGQGLCMAKKHDVIFLPSRAAVEAHEGETVLEAAKRSHIAIRADCGGVGICGKCRVVADRMESDILTNRQIKESYRLACQAEIRGPVTITVPEELDESTEVYGKTELSGTFEVNSGIERLVVPKARALGVDSDEKRNLAEWVRRRVKEAHGKEIRFAGTEPLAELARPNVMEKELTLVNHYRESVTSILPGKRLRSLGMAFDIGTTTLAAYLCDLRTGEQLANIASLNPQRRYGEDVISRITRIDDDFANLKTQKRLIIDGIDHLIEKCLEKGDGGMDEIDEIVVGGNPTMTQILLGLHPHGIGIAPYWPVIQNIPLLKASELGIQVNPAVPVFVFPLVSGFIGGDTIAGIVADRLHLRNEMTLLVDIGTNGEVVLGNRDGIWSTSCATGPALEGAQISCGMRAVSGAISKFSISERDHTQMEYYTIGQERGVPPSGICGSGIIDAAAVMRRLGITQPSGLLNPRAAGVFKNEAGQGVGFAVPNSDITILLKDIRQIQLAKSALATGIELLMRKAGVSKVRKTVLTGAFGARFNWRNALTIGLLPPNIAAGEIVSMENLAGVGVMKALLDRSVREEAEEIAQKVRFLDLSGEPDFTVKFAEGTKFPELCGA